MSMISLRFSCRAGTRGETSCSARAGLARTSRSRGLYAAGAFALLLACPAFAGDLRITEILYDPPGVNTGRQTIELRNVSERELDLGAEDFWLRIAPGSYRFPAGVRLAPGEHVLVHVNRAGTAAARELFTGLSVRELRASDSIALFRSSLFQDPARLEQFVQWGAAGHGGEAVAVTAGLWREAGFVPTEMLRAGSSLALLGDSIDQPEAWCIDGSPTLGSLNDGCSASRAVVGSRLEEVGFGDGLAFVEIRNRGAFLEDLGGLSLAFGPDAIYRFPMGTLLGEGESVVLWVGVEGMDDSVDFFTGPGFASVLEVDSGAVTLHAGANAAADPARLADYLAWGNPGSPFAPIAAAVGLWKGAPLDPSGLHARGGWARSDTGMGSAAWRIDNTPTPGLSNDAEPDAPELVLNELLLRPLAGEVPAIELFHRGEGSFDLAGVTVAWTREDGEIAHVSIPAGRVLASGQTFVIRLGASGPDDERTLSVPAASPLAREGECALWLAADLGDPENLIDFVRWGSALASPWRDTAVTRSLWPEGATLEVPALPDGASLAYLGEGDAPEAFRFDVSPSIGSPNDEMLANLPFRRGDCNDDGTRDISDAVKGFGFLFLGASDPSCLKSCDSNDDESLDISDPVFLLNYLFRGGGPPSPPFPDCGADEDETLSCDAYLAC